MTVRSVAVRDQTAPLQQAIETLDESLFKRRREFLAVKFAALLADGPFRVTDGFIAELKTEFDEDEILEMVFACATFSWGNIIGIALRVDLDGHEHYPPLDWDAAERKKTASSPDSDPSLNDRRSPGS